MVNIYKFGIFSAFFHEDYHNFSEHKYSKQADILRVCLAIRLSYRQPNCLEFL